MKNKITTKILTEIAIIAAVAFALDALQGGIFRGLFPNGGSIGIAMLPILILTFRRGFVPGFLAALILSFMQMFGGVYAIADTWYMVFLQIFLDYIIAYPLVSIAALFYKSYHKATNNKDKILFLSLGTIVGGFLKFVAHFLAGFIFWSSSAPDGYFGGPVVYSIVYNGGYMLPNIILNALILCIIAIKIPQLLTVKENGGQVSA